MASRSFTRMQALNKEVKVIAGQFTHSAKVQGLGYTVSSDGSGQYTITLDDKYSALLACTATIQAASAQDMKVTVISHDVTAASPTIVVEVDTAGVASDLAGSEAVHFCLVLQNSSIPSV